MFPRPPIFSAVIFSAVVVVVGRGEAILWCYSALMADGSFWRHPSKRDQSAHQFEIQ